MFAETQGSNRDTNKISALFFHPFCTTPAAVKREKQNIVFLSVNWALSLCNLTRLTFTLGKGFLTLLP